MKKDILAALYSKGPFTSSEISEYLNANVKSIRVILNRLEKERLVSIHRKRKTEGKELIYSITQSGINLAIKTLIEKWLKENNLDVKFEAKLDKYRIDVLGTNSEKVGVEIKTQQISWNFLEYKKYVNKLYLVIPPNLSSSEVVNKCRLEDVGLLVVNSGVREILPSKFFEINKVKPFVKEISESITEAEMKILSSFFPVIKEYTTREIEKRSGYSHERVYTTLMSLTKKRYVIKKAVGKSLVFELNRQKDLLMPYMHYQTTREEKIFKSFTPSVRDMLDDFVEKIRSNDLISVVVFGSYAKGEQREESDIDVLCIVRKKYDIDKVALSLRHRYGKRIVPLVIPITDFKNMKKDNPRFYADLVEFGVVVYGIESLYRLIV